VEGDPSAVNLAEILVDSDKAGQDSAPITGEVSTTPFEGLFHAGFLERPALPSLPSELSTTEDTVFWSSTGGGGIDTAFGESSHDGAWSAVPVVREEEEDEDDDDGSD
jgi:hypothetical protein